MSSSASDILNLIKQNSVKFIDFRFTDMFGSCYHETYKADIYEIKSILIDGTPLENDLMLNGYPYKNIILLPDLGTAFLDPFYAQSTLVILCDMATHTSNNEKYQHPNDPRSIAKKAYDYMRSTGIADQAYFGPEIGFHIFDDVKYHTSKYSSYFKLDLIGENSSLGKKQDSEEYKPMDMMVPPIDALHDMRSEILEMMSEVGIKPLSHYLGSQCGVKLKCDEFLCSADSIQKFKYVVRNVAHSYGKTATFMPHPIENTNGRSSMRCSQSLWKDGKNLFVGENNQVSETCLYYIGGIIKHGQAINAYTNPATNSYKTFSVHKSHKRLAYSYIDAFFATIRISYKRDMVQVCFPDAIANPYLCFAVQLMAGLDGIRNKIHPGDALDELSEFEELHSMSQSLQDALDALRCDREFLLHVFTNEQIDEYIIKKTNEVQASELAPNPIEFVNYYSL